MIGRRRGFSDAQKTKVENTGVLVAAGLIAGEALVGLLFASLSFFEVNYTIVKYPGMFFISMLIMAVIALILIHPPVVLFLGFLGYALSGPVWTLLRLRERGPA